MINYLGINLINGISLQSLWKFHLHNVFHLHPALLSVLGHGDAVHEHYQPRLRTIRSHKSVNNATVLLRLMVNVFSIFRFLLHIAAVNENHTKGTDAPEVEVLVSAKSTNKTDKAETPKKEFLKEPSSYGFDQNLHLKLHEIFRVHDRLCDLAEELNECYSLQLVCCITSVFILLIFGFFFETKVVFWAWGGATKLMLISTSYLLWGVIASIVIYIVLFLCTAVRDSANRSALIIHKILQMKPAFMLNDETYYNKMKSFTLQILHRKNILHFNGLGLFRLDYTFIFSVRLGRYCMYLLLKDLIAGHQRCYFVFDCAPAVRSVQ